jgi:hypothetical protein
VPTNQQVLCPGAPHLQWNVVKRHIREEGPMKRKVFVLSTVLVVMVLLADCGPAAAPTTAPEAPAAAQPPRYPPWPVLWPDCHRHRRDPSTPDPQAADDGNERP